jgi:hypothetical protein
MDFFLESDKVGGGGLWGFGAVQVRALEKISDVVQGHCVKDAQFKVIGIDSAQETVDAPDNAGHYCCQQADDDFFAIWCQSCQALLTKVTVKYFSILLLDPSIR